MVKHIVAWRHADGLTDEQKRDNALRIKNGLEGLADVIPGVVEIRVFTELLPGSTADMLLYSVFESEQFLKVYLDHPEHQRVANFIVRPATKDRNCVDCVE